MNHKEENGNILTLLWYIVERHPELRFRQILHILDLDKDGFYEEPSKTYERLAKHRLVQE